MTKTLSVCAVSALILTSGLGVAPCSTSSIPENYGLNNLATLLLDVVGASTTNSFPFARPSEGWIFISLTTQGEGTMRLTLDNATPRETPIQLAPGAGLTHHEATAHITEGRHRIQIERTGAIAIEHLTIKAIPELMHCGLGFDPQIKSYGVYSLDFLKKDILPNVTTLIIPNNRKLSDSVIEDWHRQGKRFVAEVGINSQARTAEEHATFWTSFLGKSPFIDGIIINEFIVNRPVSEWATLTPDRLARMDKERADYELYSEAFKQIHADSRFARKSIYAYVGGSGKKLNQEIIGTNVIRTIVNCGYFVAPERYLHEMSSEKGSQEALQAFIDGLADWEAKEPGVKKQMVITFGLFSMPPGSINKQPNVDYHVWMDLQMNLVANDPTLTDIAGLTWWTSSLADEETVRFVGKLYRHYAIEGRTNRLTSDPLFLRHIQNADFEQSTNGWNLHPAEEGSIAVKTFPRYGRIEGRFMGLGRPADPEHIGDTFLWMKRSEEGPNTFSQTVKHLQPGRLYSLKMLVCDYNDLIAPKPKQIAEAKSVFTVLIDGADVDVARSFSEVYASSPEPKIPVCITYHWEIFRAKATNATLIVSDWQSPGRPTSPFGQEQAFNFLEIQPYHE